MTTEEIKQALKQAIANEDTDSYALAEHDIFNLEATEPLFKMAYINEAYNSFNNWFKIDDAEIMENLVDKCRTVSKIYHQHIKEMESLFGTDEDVLLIPMAHLGICVMKWLCKFALYDETNDVPYRINITVKLVAELLEKINTRNLEKVSTDFWNVWGEYCYHYVHGNARNMLEEYKEIDEYLAFLRDEAKKVIAKLAPSVDINNAEKINKSKMFMLERARANLHFQAYTERNFYYSSKLCLGMILNWRLFKDSDLETIARYDLLMYYNYMLEWLAHLSLEEGAPDAYYNILIPEFLEPFDALMKLTLSNERVKAEIGHALGLIYVEVASHLDNVAKLNKDLAPIVKAYLHKAHPLIMECDRRTSNNFSVGQTEYLCCRRYGNVMCTVVLPLFEKMTSLSPEDRAELENKFELLFKAERSHLEKQQATDEAKAEYEKLQKSLELFKADRQKQMSMCLSKFFEKVEQISEEQENEDNIVEGIKKEQKNQDFLPISLRKKETSSTPTEKTSNNKPKTTKSTSAKSTSSKQVASSKKSKKSRAFYVDLESGNPKRNLKFSIITLCISLVLVACFVVLFFGQALPQIAELVAGRTNAQLFEAYKLQVIGSGVGFVLNFLALCTFKTKLSPIFRCLSFPFLIMTLF